MFSLPLCSVIVKILEGVCSLSLSPGSKVMRTTDPGLLMGDVYSEKK